LLIPSLSHQRKVHNLEVLDYMRKHHFPKL
jgi:hypothetical protein